MVQWYYIWHSSNPSKPAMNWGWWQSLPIQTAPGEGLSPPKTAPQIFRTWIILDYNFHQTHVCHGFHDWTNRLRPRIGGLHYQRMCFGWRGEGLAVPHPNSQGLTGKWRKIHEHYPNHYRIVALDVRIGCRSVPNFASSSLPNEHHSVCTSDLCQGFDPAWSDVGFSATLQTDSQTHWTETKIGECR